MMQGHKVWAVLPPDTEHRLLECDPKCSGHDKVFESEYLIEFSQRTIVTIRTNNSF